MLERNAVALPQEYMKIYKYDNIISSDDCDYIINAAEITATKKGAGLKQGIRHFLLRIFPGGSIW